MRIITWVLIACLGIGLVTYGITTFGEQEASAEVSQEAKGSFVRLDDGGKKIVIAADGKEASYPLSSNVWVYRDMLKSVLEQLQAGDALDLILNSKNQAAYIKATSLKFAAAAQPSAAVANNAGAVVTGPIASESKQVEATPSVVVDTKPANVAVPSTATPPRAATSTSPASEKPKSNEAVQPSKDVPSQLDKLSLEWKSRDLLLKIKREGSSQPGKATDVFIQMKDKSVVHLTGASADDLVMQLIQGLPVEQKAFEEQLKMIISIYFHIKDEKVEWKLDTKWLQAAVPSSNRAPGLQQEKNGEKTWDNAKGRDQDKDKGKDRDKSRDR